MDVVSLKRTKRVLVSSTMNVDDRVQVNGTSQGIIVKKQGRKFRVLLDGQTKEMTWVNDDDLKVLDESVGNTPPATDEAAYVVEKVVNKHTPTNISTPFPYAGKSLRAIVNEELTNGTSRPLPKPSVVVSLPKPAADESPTEKDLSTPPESPKGSRPNDKQTGDEAVVNDFLDAIDMQRNELRAGMSHLNFQMKEVKTDVTDIAGILLARQEKQKAPPGALPALPSSKVILAAAVGTLVLALCLYLCVQPYFTPDVWLHNIGIAIARGSYDICQAICDAFLAMWNTVATPLYTAVQSVSAWLSSVNSFLSTCASKARVGLASTLRSWADGLAVPTLIDGDIHPEALPTVFEHVVGTVINVLGYCVWG